MLFFGPVVVMCRIKNEIRETQISFKKRRSPHRSVIMSGKYLDVYIRHFDWFDLATPPAVVVIERP